MAPPTIAIIKIVVVVKNPPWKILRKFKEKKILDFDGVAIGEKLSLEPPVDVLVTKIF
jgi:hypothetical protein